MIKNYKKLENIIEYKFKDSILLKKALTHKSFDNIKNNEKLEFLGDRVLGLVISKKLIQIYPKEKEGIIDKKFANLVNKKTCLEISKNIHVNEYMFLAESQKSLSRSTDKIASDCLEALIGAIFIDGSLKAAEVFILKFWKKYIDNSENTLVDSKTQLQEYSLKKYKQLPIYTFYKKSGPQHNPVFKTNVQIKNSKRIVGIGSSKKNAQQNAATKLLRLLNII